VIVDKRARVDAALRGEPVDRPPFCLWRHFHRKDRTAAGLARATVNLARTYDLDLVKLTPGGLYAVEDWAAGHITVSGTEHCAPFLHTPAVSSPGAWRQLAPADLAAGALGREIEAVRLVAAELSDTPFLMTLFSPLTLAYKLAGEAVVETLRTNPADLCAGLDVLTDTTIRFARAVLASGADGIFFATQLARHPLLSAAEYDMFGVPYDVAVLDAVAGRSAITVLHLHGTGVFFNLANRYPVHAVSWHDRETAPSLAAARAQTGRAFLTGLDRDLLARGPVSAIRRQVSEVLATTKGRGLILAPSCVIPTTTPDAHLRAVRDAILAKW
jgi:uroporphyrinogen decarboxylase